MFCIDCEFEHSPSIHTVRSVVWHDGTVVTLSINDDNQIVELWTDGYATTRPLRYDNLRQATKAAHNVADLMERYVASF